MQCEICKKPIETILALSLHLTKTHKISHKDYYDSFMLKENENNCQICGNITSFISLRQGYRTTCSNSCAQRYAIMLHPERRLHYSIAQKERWTPDERCKQAERIKNSQKCKEIRQDPQRRQLQSERMIEFWKNDENKEKLSKKLHASEKFRNAMKSEKRCLKISNTMKNSEKCKNAYSSIERSRKLSIAQSKAIQSGKIRYLYEYKGIRFQSKDEFYFGVYLILNDIKFTYQCEPFEYVFNDAVKRYVPDFCVNGEFIEIKGAHFFKDGLMICPFKNKGDTLEIVKERNARYEAKHQCMIKHHVKIITDVSLYKNYVINKLGNEIADTCKIWR